MAASELESLYRLSLRLGATLDRRQESALFLEWTQAEAQPRLAVLFAADENRRSLCLLAAHGLDAEKKAANLLSATLPIGLDPWKWLHKSGARLPRSAARQRYSLPIILEGELMGLLCVVSARKGAALQDEQRLLELGLAHLAPVLRNIERYESMEQLVQQRTQALAASEERYRIISEMISDYAYAFRVNEDQTLTREWVIGGFEAITGYTSQELDALGGWQVLVYPEDMPIALARARRLLANQHDVSEFRIRRKDGAIRWLRDHGHPIWDATQGRVTRIYGAAQDITQRKLAEEASRAAEARLRSVVEQVPAIVYTESTDGKLLFISPQIEALSGYSVEQWLSEPNFWKKVIHPDDLARVENEDQRTNQTGEPFRIEYRILSREGRTLWLRDEATLIRDEAGNPTHWQGFMLDVTERKLAEEATRRTEERLRALIEQVPAVVFTTAAEDDRLLFISPQIEALSGYPVEQWLSEPNFWRKLIHPEDFARVRAEEQRTSANGEPFRIECRMIARDGRIVWLRDEAVLIRDPAGKPAFWQGVMLDITERKQREREIETQALLAQALSETLELQPLLERLLQAALHAIPTAEKGSVALLADEAHLQVRAIFGYHSPNVLGFTYPIQWGYAGRALRERRPLLIQDLQQDPDLQKDAQQANIAEVQALRSAIAVPLLARGAVIGALSVESSKANSFSETDMGVLVSIASTAALVIERARLYEEAQQRLSELSVLHRASQILLMARPDPESTYAAVHQAAASVMPCEAFAIVLEAEALGDYHGVYLYDKSGRQPPQRIPRGKGLSGQVIPSGKTLLINDYPIQSEVQAVHFGDPQHVRSILAVPLRRDGRTFGMISAQSYQPNAYNESHQRLLETLAAQFAASIENARLFEETQRRLREMELLASASASLRAAVTRAEMLPPLLDQIMKQMQVDGVALETLDERSGALLTEWGCGVWSSLIGGVIPPGKGLSAQVLATGQPYFNNDARSDPRLFHPIEFSDLRAAAGIPLIVEGKIIGLLWIGSRRTLDEQDLRLLTAVADIAANALHRARLFEQTQRQAQKIAAVNAMGRALAASLDLTTIYRTAYQHVRQLVNCDNLGISLFDQTANTLRAVYILSDGEELDVSSLPPLVFDPQQALNGRAKAAVEGQTVVVNDLSAKRQQRGGMLIGDSREPESAAYTPMVVEGKVIGLLELQSYRNHAYGEDDLDLLSMIANQIGLAIQNALLFSDVQQRLHEVELLQEVSKSLRQAQSMAEMIPVFIQHSLLAVGAQAGSIYLLDESSGDWVSTGWINTRGEWLARSNPLMRHRPGEGVTGFVGSSGEIYYTEDWRSDPITVIPPGEEQILSAYYSGISLPLRAEQRVIGVMHLWSEKRRSFSAEEQRLLLAIADMAGNALQRSRLYEETQRRVEQLNALQTVDRAISSSLDVHFSLDILLKQTITQLKVDAAGVLLYNPLTLALEYASGRGFRTREYEQSRLPMGKGLAGRAAFEQRMMLVPDLATNQTFLRRDFLEKEGFVSYAVAPLLAKGAVKGVLEIFHRSRLNFDLDWQKFMEGLALQAAIAIDNGQMFEGLQRTNLELSLAYDAAIEGWVRALDLRDRETENHTQRVTELAVTLARALGFNEQQMVHLRRGAILHDIGKMGIPDNILQKPGPLSAEEWEIMRRHPQFAYEMLSPIRYLRPALDIPYCHHERWDGSGYPQGLKGEEIPLAARLFAVVDVFDALTSNRPYRPAWPRAGAIAYLRQQAGKLFDPQIVAAFLKIIQAEGEQASPASN
ncbi:MAG: GAF domain-containing protein [Anaerolineales bacterium]|nr:GAF domain-containing protein [Anaerolineales bacterium]